MSTKWTTIPEKLARKHPDYGVTGGLMFLQCTQVIAPFFYIFLAIYCLIKFNEVSYLSPWVYMPSLTTDIGLGVWSWANAYLLSKNSDWYITFFYLRTIMMVIMAVIILLSYGLILWTGSVYLALSGLLYVSFRLPACFFWLIYVHRSKKSQVTIRHSVRETDPFLKSFEAKRILIAEG